MILVINLRLIKKKLNNSNPKPNLPNVTLIDGLPNKDHKLLKNYVTIYSPENIDVDNEISPNRHGTSMASFIVHNDLNYKHKSSNNYKVLSFPVDDELYPTLSTVAKIESIFKFILSDFSHCKVINFSMGTSVFKNKLTKFSKIFDDYAWQHNFLFLISAGNIKVQKPKLIETNNFEKSWFIHLSKIKNNRITMPGESLNGLTIGSFRSIDVFDNIGLKECSYKLPAEYSRIGNGQNNRLKPDLLVHGGKLIYVNINGKYVYSNEIKQQSAHYKYPDNHKVLKRIGTSNSTAITTHYASKILALLENSNLSIPKKYYTILAKAMIVHCADNSNILKKIKKGRKKISESEISKYIGNGFANFEKLFDNTNSNEILVGYEEIADVNKEYKINIPKNSKIILTVTLTWFTTIIIEDEYDKEIKLTYSLSNDDYPLFSYNNKNIKYGTVIHKKFIIDNLNKDEFKENLIIECTERPSNPKVDKIPFALCVNIENIEE